MISSLAASVEVTRSTATTASTLAGAAAALAFAGLGALVVVVMTSGGEDARSRRTTLIATAFVLVATTVEFGAYLVEQVSLTAEAVTAVAASTRSLVVAARLLVAGSLLLLVRGQGGGSRDGPAAWRAALVVASVAAVGTAVLDPIGVASWRGIGAVALGAGGAAVARRLRALGPAATPVAVGIAAIGAVAIVLLGDASDGWSVRVPTEVGTFDVSILPAEPGPMNEVHIIGQPEADGTPPRLLTVIMSGDRVQGPDPTIPPASPFELFLVSPDHAIAYGVELRGDDPWSIDLGFRTARGDLDVRLEVERS